ncbi:MAG: hypothetical protein JWO80_6516, partial [Bryobacterales bacterium]|nr:hypothetical protein [Bryobacterales bacterium]
TLKPKRLHFDGCAAMRQWGCRNLHENRGSGSSRSNLQEQNFARISSRERAGMNETNPIQFRCSLRSKEVVNPSMLRSRVTNNSARSAGNCRDSSAYISRTIWFRSSWASSALSLACAALCSIRSAISSSIRAAMPRMPGIADFTAIPNTGVVLLSGSRRAKSPRLASAIYSSFPIAVSPITTDSFDAEAALAEFLITMTAPPENSAHASF